MPVTWHLKWVTTAQSYYRRFKQSIPLMVAWFYYFPIAHHNGVSCDDVPVIMVSRPSSTLHHEHALHSVANRAKYPPIRPKQMHTEPNRSHPMIRSGSGPFVDIILPPIVDDGHLATQNDDETTESTPKQYKPAQFDLRS
jgi:hypothetical protein